MGLGLPSFPRLGLSYPTGGGSVLKHPRTPGVPWPSWQHGRGFSAPARLTRFPRASLCRQHLGHCFPTHWGHEVSPPASLGDFLGLQLPGCPLLAPAPLSRPRAFPALHRLDLKDVPNAILLVAPDLGVLAASSLCLGVCRRRPQTARRSQRAQEPVRDGGAPVSQPSEDYCTFSFFLRFLFLSFYKRGCFSCKSPYMPIMERHGNGGQVHVPVGGC